MIYDSVIDDWSADLNASGPGVQADLWLLAERACRLTNVAAVLSKGEPQTKLENVIKTYGLSFRGRPLSGANCSALRGLYPFVFDSECSAAFETAEMYNPELREPTLLMKIGFACSGRGGVPTPRQRTTSPSS